MTGEHNEHLERPERAQYMYFRPRHPHRDNVREPVNPTIIVPLIGDPDRPAEMALTVPQCIELATMLMVAVQDFCKRWDVAEALHRTTPLPCPDQAHSHRLGVSE